MLDIFVIYNNLYLYPSNMAERIATCCDGAELYDYDTGTWRRMIRGYDPVLQALLGTLFTWFLTAVGASLVFIFHSSQRKLLDTSLGFAAGVMTAASYWSLLNPAIEIASSSSTYGENGEYAFIPASVGFLLGSIFVFAADKYIDYLGISPNFAANLGLPQEDSSVQKDKYEDFDTIIGVPEGGEHFSSTKVIHRKKGTLNCDIREVSDDKANQRKESKEISWHRILMLIIAITVHNIPEGLAVGVGFGAVNASDHTTFIKARNLAFGIGIQNFPEGLAVSLPLRGAGYSAWTSFWYGQLSGMVEPIAGLLGALLIVIAQPLLPYALGFAAGAMIYVVVDDIIPEAQTCGNGKYASCGTIIGFLIMMVLDVGLG